MNTTARGLGKYFTTESPFSHQEFFYWAGLARLKERKILEPFAGKNSIIQHLNALRLCSNFASYDIVPDNTDVKFRDTLTDFPKGFVVCITNPPWLAKNSARRRGLSFPKTRYNDLYEVALEQCLNHCPFVATLVPESFIRSGKFRSRLSCFIALTDNPFQHTEHPSGLALFINERVPDTALYLGDHFVGYLTALANRLEYLPKAECTFNSADGQLGLHAVDNHIEDSIRFCDAADIDNYNIKHSSRHITRIKINREVDEAFIQRCNDALAELRHATQDFLFASFKGLRKDGKYRRRLDWDNARKVIAQAINNGVRDEVETTE